MSSITANIFIILFLIIANGVFALGVGIVVLVITYLSLVIGELVPKRIALNNAEPKFTDSLTGPGYTILSL